MGYEFIEHTADLGLRVTASDLPSLFKDAGLGLAEAAGAAAGWCDASLELSLEGLDRVDLLVRWLQELLYLIMVKNFRVGEIEVLGLSETGVKARVKGCYGGPPLEKEVKAVTYHNLAIVEQGGAFEATVILDL